MTLKNYQLLTGRTNTDLGSKAINASHMVLGIVGEWGEANRELDCLDEENCTESEMLKAIDEQIDQVWYCSELANMFNLKLYSNLKQIDVQDSITRLAEMIKKWLAYGKEPDVVKVEEYLNQIVSSASNRVKFFGYSLEVGLQRNIAKLQKRFPEKFSAELAIAKGDEN